VPSDVEIRHCGELELRGKGERVGAYSLSGRISG
jgi:hypothetical protein